MNVINAEDRFKAIEYGNMLSRLLNMTVSHEKKVIENPLPYIKAAYDDVTKHRLIFEEIQQAAFVNIADLSAVEDWAKPLETISIFKDDYARYKKVMLLISDFEKKQGLHK